MGTAPISIMGFDASLACGAQVSCLCDTPMEYGGLKKKNADQSNDSVRGAVVQAHPKNFLKTMKGRTGRLADFCNGRKIKNKSISTTPTRFSRQLVPQGVNAPSRYLVTTHDSTHFFGVLSGGPGCPTGAEGRNAHNCSIWK